MDEGDPHVVGAGAGDLVDHAHPRLFQLGDPGLAAGLNVHEGRITHAAVREAHDVAGIHLFSAYLLNPLASIVGGFQRALYGVVDPAPSAGPTVLFDVSAAWLAGVLAIVIALSLGLLWLAWRTFFRLSGDFAEEL